MQYMCTVRTDCAFSREAQPPRQDALPTATCFGPRGRPLSRAATYYPKLHIPKASKRKKALL
eukprot:12733078-Alexandrium_andersonii.AAC.1